VGVNGAAAHHYVTWQAQKNVSKAATASLGALHLSNSESLNRTDWQVAWRCQPLLGHVHAEKLQKVAQPADDGAVGVDGAAAHHYVTWQDALADVSRGAAASQVHG
jgi:hypothetical protein